MKITILTPSYNQGQYIEENILSALAQPMADVEHIVIDGGSTDTTVDVLKKYPHVKWVSEKDEGQADALQKGLTMATGDIIGWFNSDDYLERNVLSEVSEIFESTPIDWIIGNITVVNDRKNTIISEKSRPVTKELLLSNPDFLRQQGTFFRKEALLQAGGFDKKYHLCMDLDLWFRMLRISEPQMIDKNLAYFRVHENQKTSGKQIATQLKEMLEIMKKNKAGNYYRMKICMRKVLSGTGLRLIRAIRYLQKRKCT